MIKLKDIINEIDAEVEWRVPNNTPDEVVHALHMLIAVITYHDEDYTEYLNVTHPTETTWAIQHGLRHDYYLVWDTEKKQWFYSTDGAYFNVRDENALKKLIRNWI